MEENKKKKTRFDYSLINLIKKDDVTTFNGMGITNLTQPCRDYLANYGLFVVLTRTLAGHESDSIAEKKALVADAFKWFTDEMPKREKKTLTAEEKAAKAKEAAIATMRAAVEKGTAAEKKMVESIIAKM
ncbi:MAG: hypothetical protein WA125_00415 [Desulfosporosinus sp.]